MKGDAKTQRRKEDQVDKGESERKSEIKIKREGWGKEDE